MPERTEAPGRRRVLGLNHEQRQQERRRLVLAAALELFGTTGYAKASIEQLCQTAGIGTNSFYDLFDGKEAVLLELYTSLTGALRDAVANAYLDHHDDDDPIRPLVSAFVHGAVDDPRVAHVAFIEAAGVSAAVEAQRRDTRNQFVDGLEAIGRDLRVRAAGSATLDVSRRPGPSPRRNAVAIVGAIIEMTVDWLHDTDPDPLAELIDDISLHCHRVIDGIVRESVGEQPPPEVAAAP